MLGSWVWGWGVGVVVTDWGIDRLGRVLSVEMLGSIIWVAFSGWKSTAWAELRCWSLVFEVKVWVWHLAAGKSTGWANFSPSRPSLQPALETLDLAETWCDSVWLESG